MSSIAQGSSEHRPSLIVVEDDPAVRRSLQLLLRAQRYDVRAYASGRALVADQAARQADLLIADLRLPDGDGLSVLESLRALGWAGPAILITGFATPAVVARAEAAGFARVLEKPLLDSALADAVVRLLKGAA